MKKRFLCVTIMSVLVCVASHLTVAATIPAGSTLVVRSLETITSTDAPGTRFHVELISKVGALHPGTKMTARVVTSRRTHHSNQRLTVDLTGAIVGGHSVPVKTTGAVQLNNARFKTRNDVSVSRAGYAVPAGRVIQFRLAQPIQF